MTEIQDLLADRKMVFPEVITVTSGGQQVAIDPQANRHAVYFPGTGERIAFLQEDNIAAVTKAVNCARDSFDSGDWSRAPTSSRQAVFRRAATLIREHAEELGLMECLCAGTPRVSSRLSTGSQGGRQSRILCRLYWRHGGRDF
jgi:acyl-CoA reductase-like NAD-dependent aldehyde dehydrogenase